MWHQEGFWFCFVVVLRFFSGNNPVLGTGPYCWYHCGKGWQITLFAAGVNSLEKSQSKAFAGSRGDFLKDWMLSHYHHQPPNAVCKQVSNAKGTPELAARLQSKTFNLVKNSGTSHMFWVLKRKKSTRD